MKDAIQYRYTNGHWPDWLKGLSKILGAIVTDGGFMQIPAHLGRGHVRVSQVSDDISFIIVNVQYNRPLHFDAMGNSRNDYQLSFISMEMGGVLEVQLEKEKVSVDVPLHQAVIFRDTSLFQQWIIPAGTIIKTIAVYMTDKWMRDNVNEGIDSEKLKAYSVKAAGNYVIETFDFESMQLMNDLMDENLNLPLKSLSLRNRIYTLTEKFFKRLSHRNFANILVHIRDSDILQLQQVELALQQHLFKDFPSIKELARIAGMSESKLKLLFRQVYNKSPFAYFQSLRMQKAMQLLDSRNLSVKEVAVQFVYINVSHFSAAFKKEFGILPGKIKMQKTG